MKISDIIASCVRESIPAGDYQMRERLSEVRAYLVSCVCLENLLEGRYKV